MNEYINPFRNSLKLFTTTSFWVVSSIMPHSLLLLQDR